METVMLQTKSQDHCTSSLIFLDEDLYSRLGYIGLPTAAMIAADGYDVVGVDTNRQRVEALQSGG